MIREDPAGAVVVRALLPLLRSKRYGKQDATLLTRNAKFSSCLPDFLLYRPPLPGRLQYTSTFVVVPIWEGGFQRTSSSLHYSLQNLGSWKCPCRASFSCVRDNEHGRYTERGRYLFQPDPA